MAGVGTAAQAPVAISDPFTTLGQYIVLAGSAPTLPGSNTMRVPASTLVAFGSPAWGAVQTWQVRFQYATSLAATFLLHRTDGSNYLAVQVASGGGNFQLTQRVGGTVHLLASASITLTAGSWYWVQLTQFPSPPGDPPYCLVTVYNDSGGAIGAQVTNGQLGAGAFDAVTALVGAPAILAGGAALVIGGLASGAGHQVALFGPGGWWGVGAAGATPASCAWEQNAANTAPLGSQNAGSSTGSVMVPVASLSAVRLDAPPLGGWAAYWANVPPTITLAALQQSAIPVATGGDTLFFSGMVTATGNGAGFQMYVTVYEYDATGAQTATNTFTIASGSGVLPWQAWNWNYGATQPPTAYVRLLLRAADTTSSSAGCMVWYDNVQCWDVTATGMAAGAGAMPYCELRSPNSAAQLLVTGLLGDLPAPASLAFGTFVSSWQLGSVLNFAIGRAAQASATARLVGSSYGYFGSGGNPLASAVLDGAGYGGFSVSALMNSSWSPRCFSPQPADAPGGYHFFQRFWSGQSTANIATVQTRPTVIQRTKPWYGDLNFDDQLWVGYSGYVAPLAAGSTWTVCDAGQLQLPPQALGALTDPAQNYLTPVANWVDNTGGGGSQGQASWAALLPVDGSLLVGVLNNPNNGTVAVSTSWVWAYFDGLLTNRAGAQGGGDGPAWGYSIEAGPQHNPSRAGGGPGTQTTGSININSGADPYMLLDPQVTVAQTGQQGVNQVVGYLADGNAAVLPFAAEIAYYPLYLWPR